MTQIQFRHQGLFRWFGQYLLQTPQRRSPAPAENVHLILCIADHFEPSGGQATPQQAKARVTDWVQNYPRLFGALSDSDGRPPRHTFFYPIEEYDAEHLGALAELCAVGYGEVEIHLHHDGDSASKLRELLLKYKNLLSERHGLLARDRDSGELAYGFIHGNWSLCNGRPDGRWCGVNEELDVLRETGCYADFTMPSAPHCTQTRMINSLYYAANHPGRARSHDMGVKVGAAPRPKNSLLLVQGPLVLDWRKKKAGLLPGLENGCVQNSQPASVSRVDNWLRARIQVPSRPDWFFVKLHAHGAENTSRDALLGEPMVRFHRDLHEQAQHNARFHYHYVTAREMYNLIQAAEAGWKGTIDEARDFRLLWNGALPRESSCCSATASN
jgi:hypothetical protein